MNALNIKDLVRGEVVQVLKGGKLVTARVWHQNEGYLDLRPFRKGAHRITCGPETALTVLPPFATL